MINKASIISELCENSIYSKAVVEGVVNEFLAALRSHIVEGSEVRIAELGTFRPVVRKAHIGNSPNTGERITVAERKVPHIKFNYSITREMNEAVQR